MRGHATARLDGKGRVKIPADFIEEFLELCGEERRVYLTSLDGETMRLYPLPVWVALEERIRAQPSRTMPEIDELIFTTSYYGKDSVVDASGRILVHPRLREDTGAGPELSFLGQPDRLDIRDTETLRKAPPKVSRESLQALGALGI